MRLEPVVPFEPINRQVLALDQLPSGDHWVGQVKWDGVRMLTYYDGHEVRLINRRLNDRTAQYPELIKISQYCSAQSVILDGEIIAFEQGKPSFHQVMKRDGSRKRSSIDRAVSQIAIVHMIFDVLYLDGRWIIHHTLQERQNALSQIISANSYVQLVSNHEDVRSLFQAVKEQDLEGIVIKDLTSRYVIHGKDKRWQKKKLSKDLIAVVGGVTYRLGIVNALLLGLYDHSGQLTYIEHAGTGK